MFLQPFELLFSVLLVNPSAELCKWAGKKKRKEKNGSNHSLDDGHNDDSGNKTWWTLPANAADPYSPWIFLHLLSPPDVLLNAVITEDLISQGTKAAWPSLHIQNSCAHHAAGRHFTSSSGLSFSLNAPALWFQMETHIQLVYWDYTDKIIVFLSVTGSPPLSSTGDRERGYPCYLPTAHKDSNYAKGHSIKGGHAPTWLVVEKKRKEERKQERKKE